MPSSKAVNRTSPIMITDEMMKAAHHAWRTADKCNASEDQTVRMIAESLQPIIRAQVLEEAAWECEDVAGSHLVSEDYMEVGLAYGANECAQAIRKLAEKGTGNGTA